MICSLCGEKEAVVFIHQLIGSRELELRLCADCAETHGISGTEDQLSEDFIELLFSLQEKNAQPFDESGAETELCPNCGSSLLEIRKKNQAACPECWKHLVFNPKYPVHSGRVSVKLEREKKARMEISQLKDQLQAALDSEHYEEAARIRDVLDAKKEEGHASS